MKAHLPASYSQRFSVLLLSPLLLLKCHLKRIHPENKCHKKELDGSNQISGAAVRASECDKTTSRGLNRPHSHFVIDDLDTERRMQRFNLCPSIIT